MAVHYSADRSPHRIIIWTTPFASRRRGGWSVFVFIGGMWHRVVLNLVQAGQKQSGEDMFACCGPSVLTGPPHSSLSEGSECLASTAVLPASLIEIALKGEERHLRLPG